MLLASFPSPSHSVWDLGPIPIRAYALCIIAGIVAAIWMGERRWVARGGRRGTVSDIAVWAVIFGLIGGRLYHVITDNELYFRAGRDPWRAFYVWEGGLGVWGAIALGGVGAWIGCRRRGIKLPPFADACAPGIAVAQGIGRLGNYFNQELFGRPTSVPWAVRIDPDRPSTVPGATTYHPTFLYELLWDFGLAGVLVYLDRRYKMGRGRVFALYVMGYTAGRVWIELLRIDTANHILGLRLNVWTSILVFIGGLAYFLLHRGPRETVVEPAPPSGDPATAGSAAAAEPAAEPAAEDGAATGAGLEAAEGDAATGKAGDGSLAGAAGGRKPADADATGGDPDPTHADPADADVSAADPAATAADPADADVSAADPAATAADPADADAATDADAADADLAGAHAAASGPERTDADGSAADGSAADGSGADAVDSDLAAGDVADDGDGDGAEVGDRSLDRDGAVGDVAVGDGAVGGPGPRRRRLIPAGRRKR